VATRRTGHGGKGGAKEADRAVKAGAVHRSAPGAKRTHPEGEAGSATSDFEGLRAALLVVSAAGEVTRSMGWDRVVGSRAPEKIRRGSAEAASDDPEDALLDSIAVAVHESRRVAGPVRKVAEVSSDKARYYSISAGPARGSDDETAILVVEITEAFKVGPREGDSIRQLGHDLRTPLTSMGGAVELLQSGRLGELTAEQNRLLGMLQQGMQMMLTLIDEATEPYRAEARSSGGGGNGSGN
jgi:signal transduction histidine kinase